MLSIRVIEGAFGSIVAMLAVCHKMRKRRFLWKFYLCSAVGRMVFWWVLVDEKRNVVSL